MIRLLRKWKIMRFLKWLHELAVEGCWENDNCITCPYRDGEGRCLIASAECSLDLIEKSI
jgi:hypothetical protein